MKAHRLILAVLTTLAAMSIPTSCEKEAVLTPPVTKQETTGPETKEPAQTFSLSLDGTEGIGILASEESELTLQVTTNIPASELEAVTDAAWLHATVGDGSIAVKIDRNEAQDDRMAQLTVRDTKGRVTAVSCPFTQTYTLVNREGMVQFTDKAFKKAMLEAHDTDEDGDISPEEALAAETVEAVGRGVKDITGIEEFRNVWKIDLRDNDIEDATLVKDHPRLYWLDLKGNKHLKTFDTRGCTIYFDHCEFEVTENLLYYCWRRQVNITTSSDPKNQHSKHIKDTRATADWSRQNAFYQVHRHTRGDGTRKIVYTGKGYIDTDLEDGTFWRIMERGIELMKQNCPGVREHLEELDIYVMERMCIKRDQWMCNQEDQTNQTELYMDLWKNPEYGYNAEWRDVFLDTWELATGRILTKEERLTGDFDSEYRVLTVEIDLAPLISFPACPRGYGATLESFSNYYQNPYQSMQHLITNTQLEYGENGEWEQPYITHTLEKLYSDFINFDEWIEQVF